MFQQVEYVPSSPNGRDSTIAFLEQVIMHQGEIPTSHPTLPDRSPKLDHHDVYVNLDNRTNQEHLATQLKERIDETIQEGGVVQVIVHNGKSVTEKVVSYEQLQDVIDTHFPSGEQCWMVRCENGKYLYEVVFSTNGTVPNTLFVEVDFLPPPPPSLPELSPKLFDDSLLESLISDQVRNEISDFVEVYQEYSLIAKINQEFEQKLTCSEESMIEYLQMVTDAFFKQQPDTRNQLAKYSWTAACVAQDCVGIYLCEQGQKRAVLTVHFCAEDLVGEPEPVELSETEKVKVDIVEQPVEETPVVEADKIVEYDFHPKGELLSDALATMYPKEWGVNISEWKLDIYSRKKGPTLPLNISLVFKHNETLDSWSVVFEEREYVASGDAPLWISLIVRSLNNDPSRLKEAAIPVENVSPIVWKEDQKILEIVQKGNFVVEFADGTARYLYANSWKEMIEILKEIGAKFDGEDGKEKLVNGQQFEVIDQEGILQIRIEGNGKKKNGKGDVVTLHELSDDEMSERRKLLRAQMTISSTELHVDGIQEYGKKVILALFEHERKKHDDTVEGRMKAYVTVAAKFGQMSDIEHITLALVEFWDIPEKTFKTDSLKVANILYQLVDTVLKEIAKTKIAPALDKSVKNEIGGVVQMAELPRRNVFQKIGATFGLNKSDEERLVGVNNELEKFFGKYKITNLGELDVVVNLINMSIPVLERKISFEQGFSLYWESLKNYHEALFISYAQDNGVKTIQHAKTASAKQSAWNRLNLFEKEHYKNRAKAKEKEKLNLRIQEVGQIGKIGLHILVNRISVFQTKHKEAIALVNGVGGSAEAKKKDEKGETKEVPAVSAGPVLVAPAPGQREAILAEAKMSEEERMDWEIKNVIMRFN